ncbi:malonate decarboxylase holo-ACP synthase [Pseudomonas sp. Marseille-QA0332]
MKLRPHDLLWGLTPDALPADAPAWAWQVVAAGHPVVVRRALAEPHMVAVGLRGERRDERLACFMRRAWVSARTTPQMLRWRGRDDWPALRALAQVEPWLDACGCAWGPTGSVGYQLATGQPVLHARSDLDLVLHAPLPIAREQARAWLARLDRLACRVDLQLETPAGAIALREWAGASPRVLLKAIDGARLVSDPWAARARPEQERAA